MCVFWFDFWGFEIYKMFIFYFFYYLFKWYKMIKFEEDWDIGKKYIDGNLKIEV